MIIKSSTGKYIISSEQISNKTSSFMYVANQNDFIVQSILFSMHTLVATNDVKCIYILEDFKDRDYLLKCVQMWKSEFDNVKTINIQDILDKFELNTLYRDKYPNRYDVTYDEIVNSKMLIPLFADELDEKFLTYVDSDMEIKTELTFLKRYVKSNIAVGGILEKEQMTKHDNQNVVSKKLADNGYGFTYEQKTGSFDYLNTGILIYNIDYFKRMSFNDRIKFVKECFQMKVKCKFDFPEQDCMNVMWPKVCISIDGCNVFSYKKDELKDAKVIHYIWAGDGKKELKEKIYDYMYKKMIG